MLKTFLFISALMLPFLLNGGSNLITNSDVESASKPWISYKGAVGGWVDTEGHSGSHSLKIVNTTKQNSGWRYDYIPIGNKRTLTFGGWSKAKNVSSGSQYTLDFKIIFADGSYRWFYPNELQFSKGAHDWENKELTYTFDKEVVGVRPYVLLYKGIGTVWFDDIYVYIPEEKFNYNLHDFEIVNSLKSRVLRGNYEIAGNTIQCITEKTGSITTDKNFNLGTCQDSSTSSHTYSIWENGVFTGEYITVYGDEYILNNTNVVKNIDIDNDPSTWNSSSSYIELPNSYEEKDDGSSIAWAGLFWQGTLRGDQTKYPYDVRYPKKDGNSYVYELIPSGSVYQINKNNFENTNADKVLLKINNLNYTNIEAKKIYIYAQNLYNAYSDVTDILRAAKLKKGKNIFQVANIVSTEGREGSNSAGWSLVVIYKEDLSGKTRSISSYFGYSYIGSKAQSKVKISGFRLPKKGKISSKTVITSQEGEFRWGRNENFPTSYDWMKISNADNNDYKNMPDSNGNERPDNLKIGNRNNVFDGIPDGAKRDQISGKFNNLQRNNNGIDIDLFDLTDIMTLYRDENPNIDTIYLKSESSSDGILLTTLTFATELYTPKICYDYSLKLGDYASIVPQDRNFSVNKVADLPLELKVMIRSEEADFDLIDSKLSASFTPNDVFEYNKGDSKYSPPNAYTYKDAIETDSSKGEIAIGDNVSTDGGTLSSNIRNYAKLYYSFKKDRFEGKVDITLDTKISFDGVNKIPYTLSTSAPSDSPFYLDRCPINQTYDPVYGIVNIERGDSNNYDPGANRYSLYTQVVGVEYNISIVGYKKDSNGEYTKETNLNAVPEIELITADTFDNNSSSGYDSICQDPDYKSGDFIDFNNSERVIKSMPNDFKNYPKNRAYRNVIFRAWVLTKKDSSGNIVLADYPDANKTSRTNYDYFKKVYEANYQNSTLKTNYCQKSCETSYTPQGCYNCMRVYYGKPFCSRDNFAIRPNSYSIAVEDTNQTSSDTNKIDISINDYSASNITAGYAYKLDINATKFNSRLKVDGYYFNNMNEDTSKKVATAIFDLTKNGYTCIDKNDKNLSISIFDGAIGDMGDANETPDSVVNALIINNVGNYEMQISDLEWTQVDQLGYQYKPFPNHADCEMNSTIANVLSSKLKGCLIATGNQITDILPNLPITTYPYKFDVSSIDVVNSMNPSAKFIYISDLNDTFNQLPNGVMAMNVLGDIVAKGKNDLTLTNYIEGCMAEDTKVNLSYALSVVPTGSKGNSVNIEFFTYNYSIDKDRNISSDNINNSSTALAGEIDMNFANRYFESGGRAGYKSFINFKREFNNPINPFRLTINEFNITAPTKFVADLNSSFETKGYNNLNKTKTFYYAKTKAKQAKYEDIYDSNVTIPIGIAIYCGENLSYCLDYDINVSNARTDEYDWWFAKEHNGSSYGSVLVKLDDSVDTSVDDKASISKTTINGFSRGIDDNVALSIDKTKNITYPYTVKVKYTDTMRIKYPYLMLDPNNIIEEATFVTEAASWSGSGKTGYSVETNNSGRRNNKIDW